MKLGTVRAVRGMFTHVLADGQKGPTRAFLPSEIAPELRGALRQGDRIQMENVNGNWQITRRVEA